MNLNLKCYLLILITYLFTFIFSVQLVKSLKGKPLLRANGYTYHATPSKTRKIRWRCSTHNPQGCRAYIITIDEEIIAANHKHNHPPNPALNNTRFY